LAIIDVRNKSSAFKIASRLASGSRGQFGFATDIILFAISSAEIVARQFARFRQGGQQRRSNSQASRPQGQMPEKTGNRRGRLGLAKAIDEMQKSHDVGRQRVELGDRRAGGGDFSVRCVRPRILAALVEL
jgi:hypothetical protein